MIHGYDCQSASLCLKSFEEHTGNAAQFEMVVVPDTRYPNFLTDITVGYRFLASCAGLLKPIPTVYRVSIVRMRKAGCKP